MFIRANIIDRIRLPFRKDRELYASIYKILGFYPRRIRHYKLALQHSSAAASSPGHAGEHNERLEFLGDAVLESITSDILYHHFRRQREGFLTNTRSKIVQRETLNRLAEETGLVRLIHSEARAMSHNSNMGGNAFEAIVGAVYLDRGYDACKHFMRKRVLGELLNMDSVATEEVNFKSKLIEWCQKHHLHLEFRLISEKRDRKSSPVFTTRVVIEGIDGSTGQGYSKKESHQHAARATLADIKRNRPFVRSIFEAHEKRSHEA